MDLEKGISMVQTGRGESDGNDGNITSSFWLWRGNRAPYSSRLEETLQMASG
jgi:hypothetical protein